MHGELLRRTTAATRATLSRWTSEAMTAPTLHAQVLALHPAEIQVGKIRPPEIGYGKPPPQEQGFAAETAAVSGESKRDVNRHLARAEALGDDLPRVTGTSLDKGAEPLDF